MLFENRTCSNNLKHNCNSTVVSICEIVAQVKAGVTNVFLRDCFFFYTLLCK